MDSLAMIPTPENEPVHVYAEHTAERIRLERELQRLKSAHQQLPLTIGGQQRMGGGESLDVVQPHHHASVLATFGSATRQDTHDALNAARRAADTWRGLSSFDRASVLLRAAELVSGPWRETMNAAIMLGQSKTINQAELDTAEMIDFWRFNAYFAQRILGEQPFQTQGQWNRIDWRPLEGIVYAVTPFNFAAIGANLPTTPALLGNVVLWKPAQTQMLSAHLTMRVLEQAGMPAGVINLLAGDGPEISDVVLDQPDLAGITFTGSTATFQNLWSRIGQNLSRYNSYPRIVGETGGKDFVVAHHSADTNLLQQALIRGAYEYQGQKCSAASRAYISRSVWDSVKDDFIGTVANLPYGDISDPNNYLGAVIDRRAFNKLQDVLKRLHDDPEITVLAGGVADDSEGYFIAPTVVSCSNPEHEVFTNEYFGPLLAVHVYDDDEYESTLRQLEGVSAYGLTGSVIARDRTALSSATEILRYAAGNLYLNDQPTGSVVSLQPFGGSRASGTNDKTGSMHALLRWVTPRTIKESYSGPTDSGPLQA